MKTLYLLLDMECDTETMYNIRFGMKLINVMLTPQDGTLNYIANFCHSNAKYIQLFYLKCGMKFGDCGK